MKANERIRNVIFEAIQNQINNNKPVETAITLKRLKEEGFSEFECKQLIGQALTVEIFNVLKNKQPFDEKRYIKNLKNLPKEPFDEKNQ